MKKVLLTIMILFSSLLLISCKEKEKDTLVVGMEAAYAPFNWTVLQKTEYSYPISNQKGSYADGYDVQIAKLIASNLNKKLVIKAIEWDGLLPALASKEIDVIIAGMSPTEERKKEIAFTNIYYRSEIVMIVNNNGKYVNANSLTDFSGARIVAQRGTLYDNLITQIDNVIHQQPLDTYSAIANAVSSNTSDGFVAELPVAKSVVNANKNLKIVYFAENSGFILDEDDITVAIGLRKGDTKLLEDINNSLAKIDDNTRNTIMEEAVMRSEDEVTHGILSIFVKYFKLFLQGTLITIMLAITGTLGGFILSLLLVSLTNTVIDKKRNNKITIFFKNLGKTFANIYITIMRGTPMIIQAMIFYYGLQSIVTLKFWTPLLASIIIVILNTSAYIAEIIRGSVNALDKGQTEASIALGMSRRQTLYSVIYPQAIKNSLPSIGNEFIVNLKDTAILSIIGVLDLFNATRQVFGATYNTIAPFVIAGVIYLILTTITSYIIKRLEKKGALGNA